jgi:hypothetical protein
MAREQLEGESSGRAIADTGASVALRREAWRTVRVEDPRFAFPITQTTREEQAFLYWAA